MASEPVFSDCIFCKITSGEIPAKKVYEDDQVLAFHDIAPQAPVHILVIPKKHVAAVSELTLEDGPLMGRIFMAINEIARTQGISESGFRVITNCGRDSGQVVFHLHFHLVGGRPLGPVG